MINTTRHLLTDSERRFPAAIRVPRFNGNGKTYGLTVYFCLRGCNLIARPHRPYYASREENKLAGQFYEDVFDRNWELGTRMREPKATSCIREWQVADWNYSATKMVNRAVGRVWSVNSFGSFEGISFELMELRIPLDWSSCSNFGWQRGEVEMRGVQVVRVVRSDEEMHGTNNIRDTLTPSRTNF